MKGFKEYVEKYGNHFTLPLAEYLVRDFRYNGDLLYKGKRDAPIALDTPPLQHAFEYFNSGRYNTGDPNHTNAVKTAGKNLWNESLGNLRKWWELEGKYWYNNPNGPGE